ncbi:hypothetical protein Q3G72_002882 [Acer saccharum]|nr:hypothetical protein Q3G72_002882 [Acer saccharum]
MPILILLKVIIKDLQWRHLLNMELYNPIDNLVSLMDACLLYVAIAFLINVVAIPPPLINVVSIPHPSYADY